MGTYWDEFLYQFPWVLKLPLDKILELFWHWCGTDNGQKSTVFEDRLKSASQIAEAHPQADNTGRDVMPPRYDYSQFEYCGKRVSEMTTNELRDAVVDLGKLAIEVHGGTTARGNKPPTIL